jgi:hypothetical protein
VPRTLVEPVRTTLPSSGAVILIEIAFAGAALVAALEAVVDPPPEEPHPVSSANNRATQEATGRNGYRMSPPFLASCPVSGTILGPGRELC